ncbi:MAG: hypothetical protein KJP23_10475 [Deltaproteobacteria bacterium]|nr:hypothetical protein [Deltaproteobacteria bacterium]
MQPTPKDVHIDSALSSISVGYKNPDFIADSVFPIVRVSKQSDYYYKWLKGAWFRNEAGVRGPGTRARRGTTPITSALYKCQEYAFGRVVPIETIRNADAPIRPMQNATMYSTRKILLAKEVIASALMVTAANWTSSEDAAGGWAAGSGNTFIEDVLAAKETIRGLIGVYPNTMIMNAGTMVQCKQESTVLDRIKYTGTQGRPADVTANTLAQLFELDRVLIGSAIYSDAEEVVAGTDFNAVDLWETNAGKGACWIGYVEPQPAIDTPSAGYCFNWPGDEGIPDVQRAAGGGNPYRTTRYYYEKDIKSYVVEASEYFDLELCCADAGFVFYDTEAT